MKPVTSKIILTLSAICIAFLEAIADPDLFTVSVTNGNTFTISRTDASAASYVDYYTQSGSAVAGIHYEDVSGRLEFAVGETAKIVTVSEKLVTTIDKYVKTGGFRCFSFFIYNNCMSPVRAEGVFTNGVEYEHPSEKQQVLSGYAVVTDDYVFNAKGTSTIAEMFTDSEKEYIPLTGQTLKYKFYISLYVLYRYPGWNDIGIYFDDYSSNPQYEPNGQDQNLYNAEWEDGPESFILCKFPVGEYDINDLDSRQWFNPYYASLWSNSHGCFITEDGNHTVSFVGTAHGNADDGFTLERLMTHVGIVDDQGPVLKGVYMNTDHVYSSGEQLYVAVRFNEIVVPNITGATVNIGGTDYEFEYAGGDNTNTLFFRFDNFTTSTPISGTAGTIKLTGLTGSVTDLGGNVGTFTAISSNNMILNFRMNPSYSVTFETNEGTINSGNISKYTYTIGATLPTNVERDGFIFEGWYDNAEFAGSPVTTIFSTDSGDKTFYAKWTKINVCNIQVEETIKNARCFGESNGEISLTITNAAEPYTTRCTNEIFTDDVLRNLKAGNYLIEITDAENCSFTKTYTVTEPNLPEVSIANVTATACNEKNGAVIVNGNDNFTYHWNTGNETKYLLNVNAGDYSLVVIDGNGCTNTVQVTVPLIAPKQPEIALVTVSEQTGKNLVVWLKEETNLIDFYTIYRENDEANVYEKLTTISYSELSVFEDEEANPNIRAWRYKITATDVCGIETEQSNHHKTMHITKNAGSDGASNNLIWDNYEGLDFSTFIVMRKHKVNGTIVTDTLTTLPSNVNSFTDNNLVDGIISYYVGIKLPSVIDPKTQFMKAESGPFSIAISNIAEAETNEDVAIRTIAESSVDVYSVAHTIYVKNAAGSETTIYDINGQKLTSADGLDEYAFPIKQDGVYIVMVGKEIFKVVVK